MTLFAVLSDPSAIAPELRGLFVAAGIGLLIGVDRERRKGEGPTRAPAGIRTFTLASLSGAVANLVGGETMVALVVAATALLVLLAYLESRDPDPGITTEIALVATVLLGSLAMRRSELAAALGVAVAGILYLRAPMHRFVRDVLSEAEVRSGLVFAAATLIVWPLLPDRYVGPFSAVNVRVLWSVVILIMAISAAGYVLQRLVGPERGLPLAGLLSGFVSSSATIAAMGVRAGEAPASLGSAVAGAVLSTVATVVQLAVLLAAIDAATLYALALPLLLAGLAAALYAVPTLLAARKETTEGATSPGEAFSLRKALLMAGLLAAVLVLGAALRQWAGSNGTLLATGAAGFVDAHAAAVSVASLASAGKLSASDAAVPILLGFTTNSLTKVVLAVSSGSRAFAVRVVPGVLLVAAAAWAGLLLWR